MLSKKTKYAIKALMVLGRNYGKEPMQILRIAEEERIPKKFLEQILLEMRNAGILYSKKGAGGGYSLNKARSEEHTSELQSRENLVCRLLLEKKKEHTNNQ